MALDADGAVFTAGYFSGTIHFDSVALTAAGNFYNPFIAKYHRNGTLAWVVNTYGARLAYGIVVDREGNSCITGYFGDVAIAGTDTATSKGDQDVYLAKYDADGRPLWLRTLGGDSLDVGRGVAIDRENNLYVAGHFAHAIAINGEQIVSRGGNDVFVAKYDRNGVLRWLCSAGGGTDDRAYSIAAADDGTVYVCGVFEGSAVFGTDTLRTSADAFAPFVARIDTGGRFLWARTPGGSNVGIGRSITTAARGTIYVAGEYEGVAYFGLDTLRSHGVRDIFLARMDTSGGFTWARGAGGKAQDGARSVAVDSAGHVHCTGLVADPFFGPVIFGDDTVTTTYGTEIFTAEYDSTGRLLCATIAGGASGDFGSGVAADAAEGIYIVGAFTERAEFGPFSLQGNGTINSSGFLAHIRSTPASSVGDRMERASPLSLFPNPTTGPLLIHGLPDDASHCSVTIADMTGHILIQEEHAAVDRSSIRCDLSALAQGVYLVCITANRATQRHILVIR